MTGVTIESSESELPKVWSKARSIGAKYYDSGIQCRKNYQHRIVRYTVNRKCADCAREHAKTPASLMRVKVAYAAMSHFEKMVSWAKYRHKYRGLPGIFDLTVDKIEWPEFCPALGLRLVYEAQEDRSADDSPTIDRKNPNLGYTLENIQILSRKANRIKNDGNAEEIMRVALLVTNGAKQ